MENHRKVNYSWASNNDYFMRQYCKVQNSASTGLLACDRAGGTMGIGSLEGGWMQ